MRTAALLVIVMLAVAATPVVAGIETLEKLLDDPPATGLMISSVFDGTPGKRAGMERGDVLVFYGGRPVTDLASLAAAKASLAESDSVEIKAVRGESVVVFVLAPGQIGVNLVPVTKGVPAAPLPAATDVALDFSSLAKAPRDDWYEFILPGKGKVGFEHATLSLTEGHLVLRREVAFDGGERWGVNHFDATVKMALEPRLHVVSTRFANPITNWVGEGVLDEDTKEWVFAWDGEGHERGTRTMPITRENIPDYIVESLAGFMPRRIGACLQFRSMATGWPGPALRSALHAAAEEEIEIGGKKIGTIRFEVTARGGPVAAKHWVDGTGRVVQSHYGGPIARISTKERALAGLHEKIVPQTAGETKRPEADPLDRVLADPAATGMVAMRIVPGSQAEKAGLRRGDILVAYQGEATPDLPSIAMAKERAADRKTVVVRIHRGGEVLDLPLAPGRMGVYLLPVTEGVAIPPLPPANVRRLDFSSLDGQVRDEWFALYWGETGKRGYLHATSRFDGRKLFVRTEVAFDYGAGEGYNHTVVVAVLEAAGDGMLTPVMTRQEERPFGAPPIRATGMRAGRRGGSLTWSCRGPNRTFTGELPGDAIPTTAIPVIAELMPREVGACLHFHPLYESVGEAALPCALVVTGAEEVDLGGRSITIFRCEWRQLGGGVQAVYRIAADGHMVGADHGDGMMTITNTKEEALEGIPEELLPR